MKLEVISFKDNAPKRGKIICFSESNSEADFFCLDRKGSAWINMLGDCDYACHASELQDYGHYSHWARIGKVFDIEFHIPEDE